MQDLREIERDRRIMAQEKERFARDGEKLLPLAQAEFQQLGRGAVVSHWADGKFGWAVYLARWQIVDLFDTTEMSDREQVLSLVDSYQPEESFVVMLFVVTRVGNQMGRSLTSAGIIGHC